MAKYSMVLALLLLFPTVFAKADPKTDKDIFNYFQPVAGKHNMPFIKSYYDTQGSKICQVEISFANTHDFDASPGTEDMIAPLVTWRYVSDQDAQLTDGTDLDRLGQTLVWHSRGSFLLGLVKVYQMGESYSIYGNIAHGEEWSEKSDQMIASELEHNPHPLPNIVETTDVVKNGKDVVYFRYRTLEADRGFTSHGKGVLHETEVTECGDASYRPKDIWNGLSNL